MTRGANDVAELASSSRPEPHTAQVNGFVAPGTRLLTSREANDFLRRAPGFLEKRRSSGIDSPRYIQARPFGSVRYRVDDLLAWEDAKMRDNSAHE